LRVISDVVHRVAIRSVKANAFSVFAEFEVDVEVAAAGVAEHLRGDLFLKSAISKQIENEEMTDIDFEEIILDLDKSHTRKPTGN